MPISNPIPASLLTIVETQVFSGTAPTTWTDLDLSAVIGAQVTLVLLKVSTNALRVYSFRRKGDTDEHYHLDNRSASCLSINTGTFGVAVVVTDAAGVIQWRTSTGSPTATLDVIGFIA